MKVIIEIEIDDSVKKTTDESSKAGSYSEYARFFDESNPNWHPNPEYNLMFLKLQERYANDRLKMRGYLFLNEVYDTIGIPKSKAGQVVGWIYDPENKIGDNYVDFGIYKIGNEQFVNGVKDSILLDFNVDGMILDKIN